MFLIIHILFAIAAIAVSTMSLFSPSHRKITATFMLTIGTLLAALGLVIVDHGSMTRACMTAFVYLAIISVNVLISKKRLAKEETTS